MAFKLYKQERKDMAKDHSIIDRKLVEAFKPHIFGSDVFPSATKPVLQTEPESSGGSGAVNVRRPSDGGSSLFEHLYHFPYNGPDGMGG